MRLLQLLMIGVLSLCLTWGGAILFGPYLIERFIDRQSNGSVKLNKLEVRPNLTVIAGGLAVFEADSKIFELWGVSLDWSVTDFIQPSATLRAAKGSFNSHATINSLELRLSELKPGQPLQLKGRVANVTAPAYGDAQYVVFDASADWKLRAFDRIRISSGSLAYADPHGIDLTEATLALNSLRTDLPLTGQELVGKLHLTKPSFAPGDMSAAAAQINFVSDGTQARLDYELDKIVSPPNEFEVPSASGSLTYALQNPLSDNTLSITVEDFNWGSLNVLGATAEVKSTPLGYRIAGGGQLQVKEIEVGGRYLGQLPTTEFNLETILREETKNWAVSGEARASIDDAPVSLEIDFSAKVAAGAGVESCIFGNCKLSDLFAVYELQAGEAALFGESRCGSLVCADGASEHLLETSHTNKLFEEIQASNIVNPILLAISYAQMLAGEQKGSGHRLKF